MSKLVLSIVITIAIFYAVSCVNSSLNQPFGLIENHAGYVPARIAVLPCQPWPSGSRFAALPLSNTSQILESDSCQKFDGFVIDGFKDQPYMRGFSPQWVKKLLDASATPDLLSNFSKSWSHEDNSCLKCTTTPAFYMQTIALRSSWIKWLSDFSSAVRNADAVLLPFVVNSYEKSFIDRGLKVKQRGASVVLLLVDTNNGNLLWSGGRDAFANSQYLQADTVEKELTFPSWDLIYERLLTEDIWRDFPGRQVFR